MLSIIQRLWHVNWAEQWQYRANLFMYLLYWLVSPIVYLSVWLSIANSQGDVRGMTANDFITYYLALLIIDQLTSNITIHILAYKIHDGTLSGDLLRPIHPVLVNTLINNIAFKALILIVFIPVWIVLSVLFRPDFSAVTLQSVLLAVPGIILGFLISFLLSGVLTSIAFWTTKVYSVGDFYNGLIMLFSGAFVPLSLMPDVIQSISQYLPFQMFIYIPVQVALNQMPADAILRNYLLALLWLLISYVLFRVVWCEGVKRFSAVGA